MDIKQHHGIKIGDLVMFKHHMSNRLKPVRLVAEVPRGMLTTSRGKVPYIRLSNDAPNQRHRADDFVIVSRS
jgi:hypothetical protein